MTFSEALAGGTAQLEQAGVAEAANDAWLLLEAVTGISRARYYMKQQDPLSEEEERKFLELTGRRAQHIPLQHLTGVQWFCGYEFLVKEHVLIPRQDTECLVESALARLKSGDRVLDLCTGSGCIAISLYGLMKKTIRCAATDISGEALMTARENARRLDAGVTFYQGDLFADADGIFDCIVSNPPYIATAEIEELMPEVKEHEPRTALDGMEDGLYFYRRITEEAAEHLADKGWLLFEIGYDQGEAVTEIMRMHGYTEVKVIKDLAGLDRVVEGRKN